MKLTILSIALLGSLMACAKPATPPDPPLVAQGKPNDDLYPSPVREIEIDHRGCFGSCPVYRVRITNAGEFEYEGKRFVRKAGLVTAAMYPADVTPLFAWLRDHPSLYSKSTTNRRGVDTENVIYRFLLKNGDSVVVETDLDFAGDDLWALSNIADGMAVRALMRSKDPKNPA